MRKSDLELLEMRLEPHGVAIDRLTADYGALLRTVAEMSEALKDLRRDGDAHKTDIAQGLASIRSLLQRANRAAREVGIIEDDEVAPEVAAVNVAPSRDDVIRAARRNRHGGL